MRLQTVALAADGQVRVIVNAKPVLAERRVDLHRAWSSVTHAIQRLRDNPACADQEYDRLLDEGDPRLKAMIANPPMPDVFRSVLAQQKGHNRHDPISRTAFDQIVWRFGLKISFNPKDIAARFAKAYDYLTNGKVDVKQIQIPALLMAGEGEAEPLQGIAAVALGALVGTRPFAQVAAGRRGIELDEHGLQRVGQDLAETG